MSFAQLNKRCYLPVGTATESLSQRLTKSVRYEPVLWLTTL